MTDQHLPDTLPVSVSYSEETDTLTLEWDENDPRAAEVNFWTIEEWNEFLKEALENYGSNLSGSES